jgi:uncharacterized protein (UPF0335 family)
MKAQRTFIEILNEYQRLNKEVYERMGPSIERIETEIQQMAQGSNDIKVNQIVDGYDPNVTKDLQNVETESAEQTENQENAENTDEQQENTENTEDQTENDENGENTEEGTQPTEASEPAPPTNNPAQGQGPTQGPRITTQQIMDFIDKAIEDQRQGVQDDDANTNELSSLTSQFKHITSGWTKKLTGIFKEDKGSEMPHFLSKIVQGAPIQSHQFEQVSPKNQLP